MPTGIGSEKNSERWVKIMQSNGNHNCMHFVLLVRRHSFSGERDGEKGELSYGLHGPCLHIYWLTFTNRII